MRDGTIFFDIQPGDDMLHFSKRDFFYIFLKLFPKIFVLIIVNDINNWSYLQKQTQ